MQSIFLTFHLFWASALQIVGTPHPYTRTQIIKGVHQSQRFHPHSQNRFVLQNDHVHYLLCSFQIARCKKNALHVVVRDLHYLSATGQWQKQALLVDELWQSASGPKDPVLEHFSAASASFNTRPTSKIVVPITLTHTHTHTQKHTQGPRLKNTEFLL